MDAWIAFGGTIIGPAIVTVSNYLVMKYQFQHQSSEEKKKVSLVKIRDNL